MKKDIWQTLKVGDKIRLSKIPPEFLTGGCLHPETRSVYERLLARRRPLTVFEVRDGGPWVQCKFRRGDGKWERHFLLLNHGGIVRVKPRERRAP